MNNSLLPTEMIGCMMFGGRRGVGKSYLAATIENPFLVKFFDYEAKGEGLHNQLNFGSYINIVADKPIGIYKKTLQEIDNIKDGQFTTVIFDNISPLELGMKADAIDNASIYAKEFGLIASNITSGKFGGSSSVVNHLIVSKITRPLQAKGVKLIIVTSHCKPFWASSGPIPNKWNILGADKWQELSILTLALIPGEYAPIPAALVMKEQLGRVAFNQDTGKFTRQRRLPYRIPKCDFDEIIKYLENPANLIEPQKGETPTKSEMASYSDELTDEQMAMNRAALNIQNEEIERQEKEEKELFNLQWNEIKAKAKVLNLPAPLALAELKNEYPTLTLAEVAEMLK